MVSLEKYCLAHEEPEARKKDGVYSKSHSQQVEKLKFKLRSPGSMPLDFPSIKKDQHFYQVASILIVFYTLSFSQSLDSTNAIFNSTNKKRKSPSCL